MNFFRSDDHQVTLSQCWNLPCFAPFSGSKDTTPLSAVEPVKEPLPTPSDTRIAREAKTSDGTTVAPEG